MLAGISVIASNFPYWENILKDNNCGITTNPQEPKDISDKIIELLANKDIEQLGKNGQKAVLEKYNWGIEEGKLLEVYKKVLNN